MYNPVFMLAFEKTATTKIGAVTTKIGATKN